MNDSWYLSVKIYYCFDYYYYSIRPKDNNNLAKDFDFENGAKISTFELDSNRDLFSKLYTMDMSFQNDSRTINTRGIQLFK